MIRRIPSLFGGSLAPLWNNNNTLQRIIYAALSKYFATHCITLQNIQQTATHYNTLLHTPTHCSILQAQFWQNTPT